MANLPSLKNGVSILQDRLNSMPTTPGVYRMINAAGVVIYVGKAKNLLKRLTNYARPARLEYRIQNMVANIASLETINTSTETEALLLEANLIKKYEPKYNILLKDDKSYPYILITKDEHGFPRIVKHRGQKTEKGKYYGPFPSAGAVNKAIADLQKAFLIRPCTDSFFAARKRPCMEYQIKRCSAPCADKISQQDYAVLLKQATDFLEGRSREVQQQLVSLMEKESASMNYEKAGSYRDRIKALNQIQAKQTIYMDTIKDADIIGIFQESGQCCIQVFFFRAGRNLGNSPFYPKHTDGASEAEIAASFLMQFYTNNPPPAEIIIGHNITDKAAVAEALSEVAGHKVKITIPKAGGRFKLITEAVKNAESALRQRMLGKAKQEMLLAEVAKLFKLPAIPKRIEVYDNSHIQGKYEIGVMIVAGVDGFNKKAYRRFNIKGEAFEKGDDYGMLEEVLRRRLKGVDSLSLVASREENDQRPTINDQHPFLLIDGGAGHMSVALRVLTELKLENDIKFVCIAKGPNRNAGREHYFVPGREPFQLPHDSPVAYYLQILRDEAHRFAIGSHRNKRSKSITKSLLDEIPNIGGKRKKLLLTHFGSVDGIRGASLDELMQVEGISRKIADVIYGYLHD